MNFWEESRPNIKFNATATITETSPNSDKSATDVTYLFAIYLIF